MISHPQYETTIYALSSGMPPAGVAVVRISGPEVRSILQALVGGVPQPRRAVLRSIRSRNGDIIDRGLVLFFPGPGSFTGEDCAELQVHGGRAVVAALCTALEELEGTRSAQAGEFTRRAFENGKIDLTAVEGLGDLIAAETEMQRRVAMSQADGQLRVIYEGWMNRLTHSRSMIEAELDFSDEADVPSDIAHGVRADLGALRAEIVDHLGKANAGEIIRDGFEVVIAGPPNAGKSSLLNALAKRDVAIVSDEAGTTRDVLSVSLDLSGYAVTVRDTAGLRETTQQIEKEGIRRAQEAMRNADLVLFLEERPASVSEGPESGGSGILKVATKQDLETAANPEADVAISVRTGFGLDRLEALILERVEAASPRSDMAIPSRLRQRQQLTRLVTALDEALSGDRPAELVAESLRDAAFALGALTGRVDVEDLLDVIFSSFCIGK